MNKVNNKIDYISKTKNRTEKMIRAENHCQINSNLSCKFSYFLIIVFVAEWVALWRPITQKTKFTLEIWFFIQFSIFPIFYVKMTITHFWGGRGRGDMHIHICDRARSSEWRWDEVERRRWKGNMKFEGQLFFQ